MNRIIAASALVTSLFVASIASAETDNALFPSNNAFVHATFYATDSTGQLGMIPLATALINNSPVAATIDGIEAATYVTVEHEGESYTFPLAQSGTNKNDLWLVMPDGSTTASFVSDTGTMSLTALLDGLSVDPELLDELHSDTPGV